MLDHKTLIQNNNFILSLIHLHVCMNIHAQLLSHVRLFVTPWMVAHQAPLTMGFSRQENWRSLPFPPPGIFRTQGSNPSLLHCRWILYHWTIWEAPFTCLSYCSFSFNSYFNILCFYKIILVFIKISELRTIVICTDCI